MIELSQNIENYRAYGKPVMLEEVRYGLVSLLAVVDELLEDNIARNTILA